MRYLGFFLAVALSTCVWAEPFATAPFVPKPVVANVPAYTIQPDFRNVANRKILPHLTSEQKKTLASNAFVARRTSEEQLFYLYENNAYHKIPSFVTSDSVLHTYHIFYDFTLRNLEKTQLVPAVIRLSRLMLEKNLSALTQAPDDGPVKTALSHNVVFFAVPLVMLREKLPNLPAGIQSLVDTEVQRIVKHNSRERCITEMYVDYTQFVPRGHYTRSQVLKQYFLAMMWFGLTPMSLEKTASDIPLAQALIISEQLHDDDTVRNLWQQLYDPTVFYVGNSDDISYYQMKPILVRVFGDGNTTRFNDTMKLAQFRELAAKELPLPGIQTFSVENGLQGRQFRFMGQRFIPDSRILQELTHPKVPERWMPYGLDLFAVLGSRRAAEILDGTFQQTKYAGYLDQRKKMRTEIEALTPEDWQQNLYYGWMYCLRPLLESRPVGYPLFMRSSAWLDKSLVTALGSWTELRHDTILYAKQSMSECGEGGELPPPAPGYVEPEVQVYERLSWLLKLNKAGLKARKLLSDDVAGSFDDFADLCDFLAGVSRKELRNEQLTRDELRAVERYGGRLELLMLSIAGLDNPGSPNTWWEIENRTDRDMALVADVHTSKPNVLEEAVGHAAEIWVVAPVNGKLVLTRGAIFVYYEFEHPATDRLTDEAWQQRLRTNNIPALPTWVHSFLQNPGVAKPTPPGEMSRGEGSGC